MGKCGTVLAQNIGKNRCCIIGMPSIFQPDIVFDISQKLGRKIPVFGVQMSAALARLFDPGFQVGVKQHNRIDRHRAVLGRAKTDGVHPGLPCDIGRVTAQMRNCIGKPGSIHKQA